MSYFTELLKPKQPAYSPCAKRSDIQGAFLKHYFADYYFGLKKYLIFAAQKLLWKPRIVSIRGEKRALRGW